jgi:hypothetical protein
VVVKMSDYRDGLPPEEQAELDALAADFGKIRRKHEHRLRRAGLSRRQAAAAFHLITMDATRGLRGVG